MELHIILLFLQEQQDVSNDFLQAHFAYPCLPVTFETAVRKVNFASDTFWGDSNVSDTRSKSALVYLLTPFSTSNLIKTIILP